MTDQTKAAIRAVWEAQPGLLSLAGIDTEPGRHCAATCIPYALLGDRSELTTIIRANDAFLPSHGVTPEERRDCMVAMLDAGAFDDLGEG